MQNVYKIQKRPIINPKVFNRPKADIDFTIPLMMLFNILIWINVTQLIVKG